MKKFSQVLDRKLTEQKRSSAWLAGEIGVADGTIRNYRKGASEPDISFALKIASILRFDISECFEEGELNPFMIREKKDEYATINQRREGIVEVPLFPNAPALIAGLHQSSKGLAIDLSMARESEAASEKLGHEGAFAVRTDNLSFDCDEEYGTIICWPWEGMVKENMPILFVKEPSNTPIIRRVILQEKGRFILKKGFDNSNVLMEGDIVVLGVVKARLELF